MNSFVLMREMSRIAAGICFLMVMSLKVSAQSSTDTTAFKEIVAFTTRGVNASGARYHIDGCRYLKNGQIHVDERLALQRGLLPCSICLTDRSMVLPILRDKKIYSKQIMFRKCVFKTKSGAKCERPAIDEHRYCKVHEGRGKKVRK